MTDEEQKRIFSANLSYQVSKHGGNQTEIAKYIGVSQQTFNNWCRGKSMPRMGMIQALADYFNINHSELINEPAHNLDKHIQISAHDQDLLDKYHALDDSGREMVDMTIEMQYKRVTQDKKGTSQLFA